MNNLGLLIAERCRRAPRPRGRGEALARRPQSSRHGPAAYNLAAAYRAGSGMPAQTWARPYAGSETAAERGVVDAAEALADYYDDGSQEPGREAVRWYQRAAALGSESARERLASLFGEGAGSPGPQASGVAGGVEEDRSAGAADEQAWGDSEEPTGGRERADSRQPEGPAERGGRRVRGDLLPATRLPRQPEGGPKRNGPA
ncbi:MAG: hypothetical protein U5L11_00710 [Arhodomonas sp.]|nr:hypothetical protein [Arhodomonas sp.]